MLDRAARTVGVQLQAQAEIDGVRLLATLAIDGHGAAIVPATAVPRAAHPLGLVRVPELPPRVVALAYQRRPTPGPPARALFDVLREVLTTSTVDLAGVRLGTDAFPLSRPMS